MNYGLYIATSGMLTNLTRLDVASNNLANVNTTAYKPDVVSVRQRDAASVEDNLPFEDSNRLLERLGAGPWPSANEIAFAPGALELTNDPFDIAIKGEGFFALQDGPNETVYTRDGRFTVNEENILVSSTSGRPVLSEDGRVIRVDRSRKFAVNTAGVVSQDGGEIGQLRIRGISDPKALQKAGENLYRVDPNLPEGTNLETFVARNVVQGALEQSGVNAVQATLAVTEASRSAQGTARLIQYFDGLMDSAINTLGAVS